MASSIFKDVNTKNQQKGFNTSDERLFVLLEYKVEQVEEAIKGLVNINRQLSHCQLVHKLKQDVSTVQGLLKTYYIHTHK